ncbi:choline/ethanolamine kinase isoform X6 [Ostrinia furnacalis]|uniref:choline/ethanolamine kinase isoform X5 n=1 Tax=Ostrinia furnacalis TaxID=93504 RepID=UPI00103D4250|nr:choline/ethanolamine kinase isoform X5 [Ostrinia furnacalis]XP_028174484.1 choline/ethanolamine kinase isoform X6 [Ostrinia furnacalis]
MSFSIKNLLIQARNSYKRFVEMNKNSYWKLQMCGTEEEMREVAARICRNYLHGAWKSVDAAQLDFRRISGGLSNFLYYVALPEDTSMLKFTQRESSPEDENPDSVTSLSRGIIKKGMNRCNSFVIEEPKKVLLRIYGQVHGERAMDAIVTESVIFTLLSERRLGPKLHGVFSGGRIEEYIPARALLTKELAEPSLSMKIAEKMAAIHSMDVPLSKEPNWLWKTMAKWLKTVRDERLSSTANTQKNEEEQRIIKRLRGIDFEKEIEWVKKFIATVESPVVFCHNDLQEGNILLLEDVITVSDDEVSSVYVQTYDTDAPKSDKENNHTHSDTDLRLTENIGSAENIRSAESLRSGEKLRSAEKRSHDSIRTDKRISAVEPLSTYEDANTSDSILSHISDSGEPRLVLIDFEYCAYNYRGFDIANHFQEWGYDYTNPEHPFYFENQENCPTLEQKEIFIKEYLKHYHMNISEDKEPPAATIDEINHLLNEVDAFALASHLFWCLWSVVNASKSQIPFGYWEYALSRLETYLRLKQEVVKKDKFGFPQKRKICEVDI